MSDVSVVQPDDAIHLFHFEVHPSVLFKLGEDLITDDAQALVELVKNAYDADGRLVTIEVETEAWFDPISGKAVDGPEPSSYDAETDVRARNPWAPVLGRLRVIDDGVGMNTTSIRDGWLTVSASEKRKMKAQNRTTLGGRTPLGDKGLGRLGAQRLGRLLFLSSVPATEVGDDPEPTSPPSEESSVNLGRTRNNALIDWDAFYDADKLSAIPIEVTSESIELRRSGSIVEIRGLRDIEFWRAAGKKALERELMTILSPYDQANGLTIQLRVNGRLQDIRRNARELLAVAPISYQFQYANGILEIQGGLSSTVLSTRKTDEVIPYQTLIARDNGYAFVEWLLETQGRKAAELGIHAGDDRSFIHLRTVRALDKVAEKVSAADPGPFSGEASSIDFEESAPSAFSTLQELREFAKDMSGVRVYRDGFGIRLDSDWLGLGDQQTSGGSWYGLRTRNTTGYINLTAENNPLLEETTSREAFRDTPAWQGFYSLMRAWSKYAQDAQTFVRRGYVEYRKSHTAALAKVSATSTPKQLAENVTQRLEAVQSITARNEEALRALDEIDASVDLLRSSRESSEGGVWTDPELNRAVDAAMENIANARSRAAEVLAQFDGLVAEYSSMQSVISLLEAQIESVEEQIGRAWESVALGLSAESLTHEVEHITDGLLGRSTQILQYLTSSSRDERLLSYANFVRSNAAQLGVQAARMNPSLRYRRERKKTSPVSVLVQSTVDYYNRQWENRPLRVELELRQDFQIRINEGKFSQILDNLILNSEYWIARSIAQKTRKSGVITITVDSPYVLVEDTGPGIDPTVTASIFEAFVSTKPGDDSRGLGLYIVRELLESEGARIDLSPELNGDGRPYIFRLELQSLIP